MNDPVDPAAATEDLWKKLEIVARRIQRRDVARSLSQLDEAAATADAATDPLLTALVRLLSADAEVKNGRFAEAAEIYALVRTSYPEHRAGHLFARAGLGEVGCLLKLSRVGEASSLGDDLLAAAAEPPPELPNPPPPGQSLAVPSLMPPAASIARRLGAAFSREGFAPEAQAFLTEAQVDPASADALGAAEHEAALLLQQGDAPAAETKLLAAREAAGTQRTLSVKGWRLLLTARFQQQNPLYSETDATYLTRIAANRARAVVQLAILSRLRECGDTTWQTWLTTWNLTGPQSHPDTRLAAHKLLLAEARVSGEDPAVRAALAAAVASNPNAAPSDLIASSRDALHAAAAADLPFDEAPLLLAAGQQFGDAARLRVLHTLSKAAAEVKDPTLAARLLEQIRAEASPNAARRLQATQALAALEFERSNFAAAATFSGELARSAALSPRFRLQALDRLCAALRLQGGREAERTEALGLIQEIIPVTADAASLLAMARTVRLSEFQDPDLLSTLIERATTAAQAEQAAADHPAIATNILLVMARKLLWDFQRPATITAHWVSLGPERRDWLWSPSASWWEYVSIVLRSFAVTGATADAQALMDMALADAPIEGRVWARTAAADLKREAGDLPGALAIYRQSAAEDPSHPENARACYWLALEALAAGYPDDAAAWLRGIRRCLGSSISYLWQWEVDARSQILLYPDAPASEIVQGTKYDVSFLDLQRPLLAADQAMFLR
jgi:tetratricopeptide (TPR) repeat protein